MTFPPSIRQFLLVAGLCLMIPPTFAQSPSPQTGAPDRVVTGHTLASTHDPKVQIRLPATARYIGASRWVLYGMADCELHAFVEADARKNVKRIYWIQFEAYLPSRPELRHLYDSKRHATMGGVDFYVDTWTEKMAAADKPGSDSEHIKALIRADGYILPKAIMSVRFVHLLDAAKRKELMFIYSEDAASTGFTADDLKSGGKAYSRWPAIENGLIERAEQQISLH